MEKAKSLMLSTAYEMDGEYLGKSANELREIAENIRFNGSHEFDENEVRALITHSEHVSAIPYSTLLVDGLKWIAPPVAVLAFVLWLIFMNH